MTSEMNSIGYDDCYHSESGIGMHHAEDRAQMRTYADDKTDKSAYYYKAVLWASENGVTGVYSDGSFRLNGECSRAQMVTFLYRSRNIGK